MSKGLTEGERRFVIEYAADRNGTQAYLRAFPGSSYGNARVRASRLLQKLTIQKELDATRRAFKRSALVSAERTLRELANIAHHDPDDVLMAGPSGEPVLRPWDTISPAARKTIKRVYCRRRFVKGTGADAGKVFEVEETEVVFHSNLDALEKLGRYLGLFKDAPALEGLLVELESQTPDADDDSPASAAGRGLGGHPGGTNARYPRFRGRSKQRGVR